MAHVILKFGAVAAAMAASQLFAPSGISATAHADSPVKQHRSAHFDARLHRGDVYTVDQRYRNGAYYYDSRAQRRALRRACRAAIRREADFIGFREVDFDSRGRIDQVGPRRFIVYFGEVEFEGRRREFERSVSCEIVRGSVRFVDGVPRPGRRHPRQHKGYHY